MFVNVNSVVWVKFFRNKGGSYNKFFICFMSSICLVRLLSVSKRKFRL